MVENKIFPEYSYRFFHFLNNKIIFCGEKNNNVFLDIFKFSENNNTYLVSDKAAKVLW